MPNLVNKIMLEELKADFEVMGSCVVLSFDQLDVARDQEIRTALRETGLRYRVIKNRLAVKAFKEMDLDMREAFTGKCGVIVAPEEKAIGAAKLVQETIRKRRPAPMVVTGGVIEGQAIVGPDAAGIADMPDRQTLRGQLASAVMGSARGLAVAFSGVAAGLTRAIQARIDKDGAEGLPGRNSTETEDT